jgi:hypothetical protein
MSHTRRPLALRLREPLAAGAAVLAALGSMAGAAATDASPSDGGWHFNLVPYLWFPAVSGRINADVPGLPGPRGEPRRIDVSGTIDPDNYLSNLQMAFMLIGEARKDNWLIYTDIVYTDLGNQNTRVRRVTGPLGVLSTELVQDAKTDVKSTIWTLGGGYRIVREPSWSLDLVAGFRYLNMNSDLSLTLQDGRGRYLRARSDSVDQDAWDGIVGARGQVLFPDSHWFMPFYADIGAGSSNWTWQAILGLGYRFDWGEVTLAWRALSYQFDEGDVDVTFSGPGLGLGFRW